MNKLLIALASMALLTACGGGGDSSTSTGAPVSASAPPPGTVPSPTTNQLVTAPVPPGTVVDVSTRALALGVNGQNNVVHFTGAADLTLSGDLNSVWLYAAQKGGTVAVSGKMNTLVFMTDVAATITVTGTANTFYFPIGSTLKLEGSGAESSTIRYFQP
jgi:hypothetical protein